jgi:fimbrial isopeptide formation D2 family protein
VANSVTITDDGGDPDPECTSCTTSHPIGPQVSVSKDSVVAPGTVVAPGDTITYILTVEVSNGPTTADVVLTDTLTSSLTFGTVTSNPGGFVVSNAGTVTTFTLPSGASDGIYEVEYTVTVNPDATGTVSNSVVIEGGGDSDPECSSCSTSHPIAEDSVAIPTASTWSTILLILLLAGAGFLHLRWRA